MHCKACDKSIDVKWRAVEIGDDEYITLLEDLCGTCLLWADVATHNLPTEGLRVDLGSYGDEEASSV